MRFWGFGLEKRSLNLVVAVSFSGGGKRQLKITEEREGEIGNQREKVERRRMDLILFWMYVK